MKSFILKRKAKTKCNVGMPDISAKQAWRAFTPVFIVEKGFNARAE
jgi:hypothetical protein